MLTADQKTVLRTGFGTSVVEAYKGGGQLYKNLPYYFSQVINTDQNGAPPLYLSNGLPTPTAPDLNNEAQLSSGSPECIRFQSAAHADVPMEYRHRTCRWRRISWWTHRM